MKNHHLFLLILLMFMSINIFGKDLQSEVVTELNIYSFDKIYSLNRNCYFTTEDDIDNIKIGSDYTGWVIGNVAGDWSITVPDIKDFYGTGWYKLPINILSLHNYKATGIYVPLNYGSIEVYINNSLIYKSSSTFGSKPILIKIPQNSLNIGLNHINLRVTSFSGWGGFAGFMEFGSFQKLQNKWILFIIKNVAISFICIFLAIYFLIMYIYRKREKYNIIFSGLSLSIAFFILGYNGIIYYMVNYPWAYWILTFVGGINMYLLPILFIHSFFNLKQGIIGKIFIYFYSFLTLFIVIEYLLTGQIFYFNKYLYIGFNSSYIFVVIYLIVISIQIVKKRLQYSKIMLIAIILLSVTFIYSMLVFSIIIDKSPLIGEGFFLMVLVFSVVLAKRFAQTHTDLELSYAENLQLNRTLEDKVIVRTAELKEKNDEVIQSIDYSALIQNSMLPSYENLDSVFSDFYVIWRPKDIVGGDFYWFSKQDDDFLIAIIDCTGHGVPGALLTMTATSSLERIVTHINSSDPGKILSQLNVILKSVLSQDNPYDIKDDGLDIGLCHYSTKNKKLTFAGSKIRLHVDNNGEFTEIKGDRQGIGYKRSKEGYIYTNHIVDVTDDTTFHMTTDGFPDQHGGDKGFGFGWTRYKKLLEEYRHLSLGAQVENIEAALFEYQGSNNQRDDITLLGFKVRNN